MNRRVYAMIAALLILAMNSAKAESLKAENLIVNAGTQKSVGVMLAQDWEKYAGFQLDVILPAGVTLVSEELSQECTGDMTYSKRIQEDGSIRYIVYSPTLALVRAGKVMTLQLKTDKKAVAGEYSLTLKNVMLTDADGNMTYLSDTMASLTVAPPVKVTVISKQRVYGDENGLLDYELSDNYTTGYPSIECAATPYSSVGTYPISIGKGSIEADTVTLVNGTLTITKAPLTIYGGEYSMKQGERLPTFKAVYSGFKNNETEAVLTKKPTLTTTATLNSAPGIYKVTVSGAEAKNYEMTYKEGTLTINQAEAIIITAKSYTREYGDDNPMFDFTSEGAALSGTPSVTCSATKTSPVGTYDIVVSKGSVQNGNVTYVKGTLTITKAPLTVIADDKTMKEGDNVPELTVTYKGFKNGETESVLLQKPTVTTSANPGSPQGQYTISVAGALAENYDPIYVNGVMTVTKPDMITVTVKNCERGYGEQNPQFDYDVTGGILNGKPDMVCDAKVDSPVGTYEIRISKGSISYSNVKLVNGVLTVQKAPLTVTADNKQMKQGEPLPELTFTYDGFKKWDDPESLIKEPIASTTATSNSAPGTYLIIVSGGEATNYDFIYKSGTLTINQAETVIITAKSYTREYGDDNPIFDFTSEGAVLSGTPSVTCSATKTSPVGTYDIVVSKGSVQNGNVTYVKGTLTITKAPLTVIADDKTMKEGDNVPELTVTYKGFKNGETESVLLQKPTVTTSANPGSPQGQYTISVAGAWAENYDPIYVNGVMTVTKPDLITVTVKNCERGYGEQNPQFDYDVTGGILNGKPDMVCEAKFDSPVGTYEIRISKGNISYSNVKLVNGVLTVKKASLTVTADNKQMKQGEPLPELTFTYDGFKKWDDPESLIKEPIASTTATSNSAPGTYLIIVSGGEATNYDFIYKSGTLTIDGYNGSVLVVLQKNGSQQTYSFGDKPNVMFNGENLIVKSTTGSVTYKRSDVRDFYFGKASSAFEPALVMALNQTREYGDSNPSLRYESAGGAYRGNPDVSTTATASSPVGTYPIILSQGGVDNDNVTFVNGTLTITKAPLTVTADDQTIKQGEFLPELTFGYSGFKNGETESVLKQCPIASTQATSQSEPGEYKIELSGGLADNYTFIYIDGILTVTEPEVVNHMLVVHLNNGTKERFLLSEQPNVLFVGSRLVIKTFTAGVVYERADIKECTFEDATANSIGQAIASEELLVRQVDDEHLIISGLNDDALIQIYDLNGRLLQTIKSVKGCESEVQLPASKGIYLINIANKRTIKIRKK